METPFESYIQFAITGYFAQDVATECPEKLMEKYYRKISNKTFPNLVTMTPLPFTAENLIKNSNMPSIYCTVAMPFFIIILILNRKKYLATVALIYLEHFQQKSYGIRLFTNHYIAIHIIRAILLITVTLYEQIWSQIYYSNIICTVITMDYSYDGPPEKSKIILPDFPQYESLDYISFPRAFYYIDSISDTFNAWTNHIWSILLILHRSTTYIACSHPFIFKQYFGVKRLRWYYICLDISTYIILHVFKNNILYHSGGIFTKQKVEEGVYILEIVVHCIITFLSIYSILARKYLHKTELNEMRYFLYFSITPMTVSFYTVLCRAFSFQFPGYMYLSQIERTSDLSHTFGFFGSVAQYSSILLSDFRPIYDCLIFFICIPHFRKTFAKVFCCKKASITEITTLMPQGRLLHRRLTVPH